MLLNVNLTIQGCCNTSFTYFLPCYEKLIGPVQSINHVLHPYSCDGVNIANLLKHKPILSTFLDTQE